MRDLFGRIVEMEREALLSDCGRYRYLLGRRWGDGPALLFVMLNPSTADTEINDPTIRRCIEFSQALGFLALQVVNLFAWRATYPAELASVEAPVGPENDDVIRASVIAQAERVGAPVPVVCAWGAHRMAAGRAPAVLDLIRACGGAPMCLTTGEARPNHPLYLPAEARLVAL